MGEKLGDIMAQKTLSVLATLGKDQDSVQGWYDIFDLPYDKLSADNRLVINQDVCLGNAKNAFFPCMRYVDIQGTLNCGKYQITPDTVLPGKFTALDCSYAIQDLGVLVGKLPPECGIITIRHALFNNIKADKDGALYIARQFMNLYPNVIVTDGKTTLKDWVAEINTAVPVAQVTTPKSAKTIDLPEVKTEQWYSAEEVADFCRNASPLIAQLPDKDLDRLIQQARSTRVNLKLRVAEKLRQTDGVKIICVHRDDVPHVADYVAQSISAVKSVACPQSQPKQKKTMPATQPVQVSTKKKGFEIGSRSGIRRVKIDKYFSRSAWKKVQQLCGTDKQAMLRVLNAINSINIIPGKTEGNAVYYVDADGKLQKESSVEFKSQDCLAQSLGSLNNGPRIVWAVSGTEKCFVAEDVFSSHARGKQQIEYKECIRATKFNPAGYNYHELLSVPDLIEKLSAPHARPAADGTDAGDTSVATKPVNAKPDLSQPVSTNIPDNTDVTSNVLENATTQQPTVTECVPVITQSSAEATASPVAPVQTTRPRRPRIMRPVTDRVLPNKKIMSQSGKKTVENKARTTAVPNAHDDSANPTWGDVYALAHKYEVQYKELADKRTSLITRLSNETETEKMLGLTEQLRVVLMKMQERENAIAELQNINQVLHRLRRDLGKGSH